MIPDIARWSQVSMTPTPWSRRMEIMAGLIHEGETVLDVGAGSGDLEWQLPPACKYLALDCVDRLPGVILLDLDRAESIPARVDVAVLAGVLEYLAHPVRALRMLAEVAPRLVLSYHAAAPGEDRRDGPNGWISHLYEDELLWILTALKLRVRCIASQDGESIYEAVR